MAQENFWFVILFVTMGAIVLPAQIFTIMHFFRRVEEGKDRMIWIILIFMLGLMGVLIYFIMPISHKPRVRDYAFDFLCGCQKKKPE